MANIVPKGFSITAHPIFSRYLPPVMRPETRDEPTPSPAHGGTDGTERAGRTLSDAEAERETETETSLTCAICLDLFADPVTIVRCEHHFCFACVDAWFSRRISCPLCKTKEVHFLRNTASCGEGEEREGEGRKRPRSEQESESERGRGRGREEDELELWTYYPQGEKRPRVKRSHSSCVRAVNAHRAFVQRLKQEKVL